MTDPQEQTTVTRILRSEVSFYGTIICAVLALAAVYYGLKADIALLTQEVRFHTSQSGEMEAKVTAVEVRLTAAEKDILVLKKN